MIFARLWDGQIRLFKEVLAGRLGVLSSLDVLDIGCCDGIAESHLAGSFNRLVASDLEQSNLEKGRMRGLKDVEWVCQPPVGDPVSLVFKDAEFDAIAAFSLFHHYDSQMRIETFHEIHRILKPGGLAVIYEANPYCPIVPPWFFVQSKLEGEPLNLVSLKRMCREANAAGLVCEDSYVLRPTAPKPFDVISTKKIPIFVPGPKYAAVFRKTGENAR